MIQRSNAALAGGPAFSVEQFIGRERQEFLEFLGGDQFLQQAGGGFEVGEVA